MDSCGVEDMEPRNPQQPVVLGYFYGGVHESFLQFKDKFDLLAWSLQWDQEKKLRMFPGYLKGVAQDAYLALPQKVQRDWERLKQALVAKFLPAEHLRLAQSALMTQCQRPDESVASFATEMEKLIREAFPTMPAEHRKQVMRMHFIYGLRPGLKEKILTSLPTAGYEEAFAVAKNTEAGLALTHGVEAGYGNPRPVGIGPTSSHQVFAGFAVKQPNALKDEVEQLRKQVEKLNRSAVSSPRKAPLRHHWSSTGKAICSACDDEGHIQKFCHGKPGTRKKGAGQGVQMYSVGSPFAGQVKQSLTVVSDDETEVEALREQVKALQDRLLSKAGF